MLPLHLVWSVGGDGSAGVGGFGYAAALALELY